MALEGQRLALPVSHAAPGVGNHWYQGHVVVDAWGQPVGAVYFPGGSEPGYAKDDWLVVEPPLWKS